MILWVCLNIWEIFFFVVVIGKNYWFGGKWNFSEKVGVNFVLVFIFLVFLSYCVELGGKEEK